MYVSPAIKGMNCPICKENFLWIEGKNKKILSLSGELNCPSCNTRLKYPSHLRGTSYYGKLLGGALVVFPAAFWLFIEGKDVGVVLGIGILYGFVYWVVKLTKLRAGYIPMELVK